MIFIKKAKKKKQHNHSYFKCEVCGKITILSHNHGINIIGCSSECRDIYYSSKPGSNKDKKIYTHEHLQEVLDQLDVKLNLTTETEDGFKKWEAKL